MDNHVIGHGCIYFFTLTKSTNLTGFIPELYTLLKITIFKDVTKLLPLNSLSSAGLEDDRVMWSGFEPLVLVLNLNWSAFFFFWKMIQLVFDALNTVVQP